MKAAVRGVGVANKHLMALAVLDGFFGDLSVASTT